MSYHGVECELYIQRLTAEGMIPKEFIGILDGTSSNQSFYTWFFPITTGAGVTTDAETEVNVYTDDATPGTWTEYVDDGTDFLITGATGEVEIQAAENTGGNINERISIDYFTIAQIAYAQSFTYDFDGSLQNVHGLGARLPKEIKEGPISMGGRISSLYVNRRLFGLWKGESDFYNRLADYTVYLYPGGKTIGQPEIEVSNCKFGGPGTINVDVNSILAIDVSYSGLAVDIGTVT